MEWPKWPRHRFVVSRGPSLIKTPVPSRIGLGFVPSLPRVETPGKVTHELASRRSDKPNPLYYAQRTVDVASARQWFLDGAPIDDVITMLGERRRFRTSRRTLLRSCAGDCDHGSTHGRTPKDWLNLITKENGMPLLEVVQNPSDQRLPFG